MNLELLKGLAEHEARGKIREFGKNLKVRVMRRDGIELIGAYKYDLNRINLEFDKGKVTKAWVG